MLSRRILVVDDEALARQRVCRFLREREEGHTVREASNGVEALKLLAEFQPEILLLDISMPGMSGMEVLYHLEKRDFALIFQTAHDEFAVKAFEENACDYLLKPFTRERFDRALERAFEKNTVGVSGVERDALAKGQYLRKVAVHHRTGLRVIDLDDITYFVSRDHYTHVGTAAGEAICNLSIAHLAERLPPEDFLQTHRHCIVRLDSVATLKKGEPMEVGLKGGTTLPVARSRRRILMDKLNPFGVDG